MAFKLMQAAQDRWRAVNAPQLVALVRAGATFIAGELVERPDGLARPAVDGPRSRLRSFALVRTAPYC
jgi:hypothetical protein